MPDTRECPLCGGSMHITDREVVVHVPGNAHGTTLITREWICPGCDYFEEAEQEGT